MPSVTSLAKFRRWKCSLSARLMLTYVFAWLVAALFLGAMSQWLLSTNAQHGAERAAAELVKHIRYDASGQPFMGELPKHWAWLFGAIPSDAGYRILDAQGHTLQWSSDVLRARWQEGEAAKTLRVGHDTIVLDGVLLNSAALPLNGPNGQTFWFEAAVSERMVNLRYDSLGTTFEVSLVLAAVLSVLLLGFVLWRVLQRVLAPIQRVSAEAAAIQSHGPGHRLSTEGLPREIEPVIRSFNQALDRLEEDFERQKRFLADAAHELKTPLALLRAQVELDEIDRVAFLADVDQMSRQVQQLLMLAEVSEPMGYQHAVIDLPMVALDTLNYLAPLAAKCKVQLQYVSDASPTAPPVQGDRSALFVLLKNLIENAIHVSPADSDVTLHLSRGCIRIWDQGPGVAPEYIPRLFERFWRVPGSRPGGAGLGLSICHQIAIVHGWRLVVRNLTPGAEFCLEFAPDTSNEASA